MGLLTDLLRKPKTVPESAPAFTTLTEFTPSFSQPIDTRFGGGVYAMELTRACIDRFATTASKLKPEVYGTAHPAIAKAIKTQPNQFESWPDFLQKVATRFDADAQAYICPVYAKDMITKVGFYSVKADHAEIIEYKSAPWIKFFLSNGQTMALPLSEVCLLSKYPYISDFFSDPNCLENTLDLMHSQNNAQKAAIENGANIRFIGALNGQVREEEMEKKRKRFVESNLKAENNNGLMIYDQTFSDVKQVEPQSYVIASPEMERIEKSIFNYFGCNEKVLQNAYSEDEWGAWYEGKIEPFALKLGSGLSRMCFTQNEQKRNGITFSSSRLEYASNASKRNMIRDMLDRGVFTINQALDILQLPNIGSEGDVRVIRGEYVNASSVSSVIDNTDNEEGSADSDDVKKDQTPESQDNDNN